MTTGPQRVAVFAVLWEPGLGDLLQRNTFLHLLRTAYPDAEITLVVGEQTADRFSEFLSSHTHASRVVSAPDFGAPDPVSRAAFLGWVRDERFDLAVLDPDSLGFLAHDAASCAIPARIGFATGVTDDRFLTTAIRLPRPIFGAPDLVDFTRGLADVLGLAPPRPGRVVAPFPHSSGRGTTPRQSRPVVVVFPGGAPHWNRRWPAPHYVDLCVRLTREHSASIVLAGDAAETEDLGRVQALVLEAVPEAIVTIHAGRSLDALASLFEAADVIVGNDSAPAHLAASMDLPSVVIYGPTGTEFFIARAYVRQRGINHRRNCQGIRNLVRGKDIENMPCEFRCVYGYQELDGPYARCLTEIDVEEVYRGVLGALRPAGSARVS